MKATKFDIFCLFVLVKPSQKNTKSFKRILQRGVYN